MNPLVAPLGLLAAEASQLGYAFMDRLIAEAKSGRNKFDKSGECFCGVFYDDMLVGCGGINQDPYVDQDVGRLRHVYILSEFRAKGLGSALVKDLLQRSKPNFGIIRLRTSDSNADTFYQAIGFAPVDHESATHLIET
ncbi:MAG: GNAT family N-acetyltransferase [Pelagimonas sp.]|uniref:GNAT family N-acetyltransferase n=1 Tax=Pelagimonas sp. TaxID=2073170 RepID=UPI003D6A3A60